MLPNQPSGTSREVLLVSLLILSVCLLTLTPTLYVLFHALRWDRARALVELAFPPLLLLAGAAFLFAYRRVKARGV